MHRRPSTMVAAVAAPAALLLAFVLTQPSVLLADGPTLLTITPDGAFEDWASVLTNPLNVTRDGDGADLPCPESDDRDCRVPSNAGDLDTFAWTYDATNLYLYIKRFATPAGTDSFYVHLDLDRDRLVQTGEPILRLRFNPSGGTVEPEVFDYTALAPGGDPIEDGLGFADGHTLPGDLGASRIVLPQAATGQGEYLETAIPWSALGLSGVSPVLFHVGVNNSCCSPDAAEDNLGGPDDRAGDLGFLIHSVEPPGVGSYGPDDPIEYLHIVTNDGNLPDRYAVRALSSEGYSIEILEEITGDPFPDVSLAFDRRGDGDFIDSQDQLWRDDDGDTLPESPVLQPGETWRLVLRITPTNGAKSYVERTTLETISLDGGGTRSLLDLSAVGEITLIPNRTLSAEAGTELRWCHQVSNHLVESTLTDFSWVSTRGWTYQLMTDPDGDCDPSDGFPLVADSNADGRPDLNLTALETVGIVAVTTIPGVEPIGTGEQFELTASSEINNNQTTTATVRDVVTVADLLALFPTFQVADGTAKSAPPGGRVWLRHVLTYSGETPDSFQVTASTPPGNTATIWSDPNGDGRPADGTQLGATASTGTLEAQGGRYPLLVAFEVDPAALPGETLPLTIEATSQNQAGLQRTIQDEIIVARVAAYDDELYAFQESRFPLCSTIFARATGLVPSQVGRYRMVWTLEPDGTVLRTTPFSSDADGFGYDELVLDDAAALGDYAVAVEEWNGSAWQAIDRDAFSVDDFGVLDSLDTDARRYFIDGKEIGVTAVFRNDAPSTLKSQTIRYALFTPDRSQVLQPDGTFAPAGPNVWTRTTDPFELKTGESLVDGFTLGPVSFPEVGTYVLQAVGEGGCGSQVAVVEVTFEVVEDSDGDGWRDDIEEALGTDPFDQDSDDDGLPDAVDGDLDSDGDTWIDALDCDSDDDGLLDSVESGLTTPLADTDLEAGCFQADADGGATVTDPRNADSDGGGEADGIEDLDRNGRLDAGEKNPLDASDDPCSWMPPPEVPDLRVSRYGVVVALGWGDMAPTYPCASYAVLRADITPPIAATDFSTLAWGLASMGFNDLGAASDGELHFYLLRATGRIGGTGALGHYGE